MHELLLAQGILQAALDEVQKVGGKRIREIHAKVRRSSHHTEDASSLEFCLGAVTKGTIAEGAEMRIEFIPSTLRCKECDFTFLAQGSTLVCPRCKGRKLEDLDTDEVYLEDIHMEQLNEAIMAISVNRDNAF